MFVPGPLELIIILTILGTVAACVILPIVFATKRGGNAQPNNPNLRPCPDCGHHISVRATTCPNCGGPVKGQ
jgi:hypothetical protein